MNNNDIESKANMCLNCNNKPCSKKGCPLNNDIPLFISAIKEGDYKKAYDILCETTVLPAICGRICPHYKQCMGSCVRGIKGSPVNIGDLEAFVGDIAIKEGYKIEKRNKYSKKVAIVGGGPAGLTAAAFLAKEGNDVTIYEKYNYLGGLLIHGIPDFRLPKEVVKESIDKILKLGIKVEYNKELGKNLDLIDLENNYDNIILACGANISSKLRIDGEELNGVYGANELLEYNVHPDYTDKTVIINGGGNVAMDAARTIKKLGAKRVIVVYRRAKEQMPAEEKEIQDAIDEGIEFLFQHNIVKIIGKSNVEKIEVIKTKLIKKEGEARLSPVDIENSNYEINADYVVTAIGAHPQEMINKFGLKTDRKGYIEVNEKWQTSNSKIFAIGDLAGNTATVAWAARSGRDVAKTINGIGS